MYTYAYTDIGTHSHTYVNGCAQMIPYSSGRNVLLLACESIEELAYSESMLYLLWRRHVDASCEVETIVLQCCFQGVDSFPPILGAGGVKNRATKTLWQDQISC